MYYYMPFHSTLCSCSNQWYLNIIHFVSEECKIKGGGEKIKGRGFKKGGGLSKKGVTYPPLAKTPRDKYSPTLCYGLKLL